MILCALATLAVATVDIYVSSDGRDTNSGTKGSPYATLGRVQERLKELTGRGAVVHLKGRIQLDHSVTFGPEAGGARFVGPAVLSGGAELQGWRAATFNGHSVWACDVPAGSDFKQLFVGKDGFRAERPTLPKVGYYWFSGYAPGEPAGGEWNVGQTAMRFGPGDLNSAWRNLPDVDVVAHHFWVTSRLPIASIDGDVVRFGKKSVFRLRDDYSDKLAPYLVENVAEAMDSPGQWYLDRPAHTVYYFPRKEDRLDRFLAVAPRVQTLVRVDGAKGVTFENVAFRDTSWSLPADSAGDVQAAFSVPGAVQVASSDGVELRGCWVEHAGGYGVEILGSSKGCRIERCALMDLGAGGVKIDDGPSGNVIADNTIEGGGRVFASGIGVLVKLSGGNQIVHNRIRDFYYTGISVGWDWGFRDTAAHDNLIAYNDISEIGQDQLSDMGGIYVLGKQPGSRIEHNRIRNVSARGYGGWGIYLDEGSTGWMVEDNVVLNTKTGGFHIHYGGNNVIRNNIFAYARLEGQLIRQRDDKQGPIRFERNLVVARPGDAPLVVKNWLRRDVVMTGNLYAVPKTDLPFGDDGTGRFVEVRLNTDGSLPANSPVYGLGFRGIDLRSVGPRP